MKLDSNEGGDTKSINCKELLNSVLSSISSKEDSHPIYKKFKTLFNNFWDPDRFKIFESPDDRKVILEIMKAKGEQTSENLFSVLRQKIERFLHTTNKTIGKAGQTLLKFPFVNDDDEPVVEDGSVTRYMKCVNESTVSKYASSLSNYIKTVFLASEANVAEKLFSHPDGVDKVVEFINWFKKEGLSGERGPELHDRIRNFIVQLFSHSVNTASHGFKLPLIEYISLKTFTLTWESFGAACRLACQLCAKFKFIIRSIFVHDNHIEREMSNDILPPDDVTMWKNSNSWKVISTNTSTFAKVCALHNSLFPAGKALGDNLEDVRIHEEALPPNHVRNSRATVDGVEYSIFAVNQARLEIERQMEQLLIIMCTQDFWDSHEFPTCDEIKGMVDNPDFDEVGSNIGMIQGFGEFRHFFMQKLSRDAGVTEENNVISVNKIYVLTNFLAHTVEFRKLLYLLYQNMLA